MEVVGLNKVVKNCYLNYDWTGIGLSGFYWNGFGLDGFYWTGCLDCID